MSINSCPKSVARHRLVLRRAGAAAFALLLVGITAGAIYLAGRQLWASSQYRAAQQAQDKRDLAGAWDHIQRYVQAYPSDVQGHLLAARIARRGGLYAEAEEQLRTCQRLAGPFDAITLERMLLHAQRGDMSADEEERLQSLVEQDHPDAALILEGLGKGYMKMYRLSDALDCFEKLSQQQPTNTYALMRCAWIYEKMSRFDDVMDAYRRVLEIEPNHTEARLGMAQGLLYGKKEAAEAMKQFEQVRQQDPANVAAAIGIAECQEELGRADEAHRQIDELVATHPDDPQVLSEGGKLALRLGREEQAEDLLRRALAQSPYSQDANYNYYLCLVRCGKVAEAQRVKAKMDAIDADVKRMARLTHELQSAPNSPEVRDEIAQIFMRLGEEAEGARWLKTALQVAPGHRPTLQALAEYYDRTGNQDLAAQYRALAEQAAEAPGGAPPMPPQPPGTIGSSPESGH